MSGLPPATAPATHTPGGTLIPLPPVGGTGSAIPTTAPGGTTTASRVNSAYNATFSIPHGISLPLFDGSDWATCSGQTAATSSKNNKRNGGLAKVILNLT